MMFLGLRKLGNTFCGHKMFLNKIRNIFCVCNKCCARGQTRKHFCRQQCVRNNVSSFARALTHKLNRSVHGHEWKRNGKAQYCKLFLFKTKTDNRVSWVQNWSFLQSDEIIAVKNVYYRGLKSKLCFAYRNGC